MPTRRETPKRSDKKIERTDAAKHRATARTEKRQTHARQTSVAIVGAGRLGSALALALSQSGYQLAALVARRGRHARLIARTLSPRPLVLDATRLDLLPDTVDLILITTPDDQLTEVAARLAEASAAHRVEQTTAQHAPSTSRRKQQSHRRTSRVALHASGALTSDALAPLRDEGFSLGSLHPLVSISEPRAGARSLTGGAFYCLEGDAPALAAARRIVRALGGRSFSINARDKSLYHAAAVITSGHTVALFSLASDLLSLCGLTDRRARQVLLPLLASTLDNLRAHAPGEALTGTFARADLRTVRKHLAALGEAADTDRDALAVYALLGARSLRLAARRHSNFDPAVAKEIATLLRRVLERPTKR
ncbi:MAG TPA: DUF2520 domain-containing protein [Pyrinomonadaceae bacterium]|nr:DUF2520 domain-containing protein [Pyrinomonadaceae bacterium]